VAGKLTAHGGAILANDMHLMLNVPNLWYRAVLITPEPDGSDHRLVGVTLPGAPALVVGSNGHVAWGFTNTEGDWTDLVVLEPDPSTPGRYLTPFGSREFRRRAEVIKVKGERDRKVVVETTVWGPVLDRDHLGRRRALRWVAYEPGAVNLELLRMESARSLEDALAVAPAAGLPAQNLVVVDSHGGIAWTVAGRIPRRVGFDGRRPGSWADGTRRWDGWLDARDYPRVVNPADGRLWTANNRVVGEPWLSRLGVGNYDRGARARQIRDALKADRPLREADMLAIQLDDRAVFLGRWQKLLLETLSEKAVGGHPEREALRRAVTYWGGRAAVDSVGFRVVRAFRWRVHGVRKEVRGQSEDFESALRAYTWGAHHAVAIRHPFSGSLGAPGRWLRLDMPAEPLPGDGRDMPRVQGPSEGASQRLAVSPGREEEGFSTCRRGKVAIRCRRSTAPGTGPGRRAGRRRCCRGRRSTSCGWCRRREGAAPWASSNALSRAPGAGRRGS
jgi:penicillin amidase